jgi:hypothetical protein
MLVLLRCRCAVSAEHRCASQLKIWMQCGRLSNSCQPKLKTALQQYRPHPVLLVLQEVGLTVLLPAHTED